MKAVAALALVLAQLAMPATAATLKPQDVADITAGMNASNAAFERRDAAALADRTSRRWWRRWADTTATPPTCSKTSVAS